MRIVGIALNLIGLVAAIFVLAIQFLNIGSIGLVGGDGGPTAFFITPDLNRGVLIIILFFLFVFAFNTYSFIKKKNLSQKVR